MKKMKYVKLCFENVEVVEVPAEYFANFLFDDIYLGAYNDWHSENVWETETTKHAMIVIKPTGNFVFEERINASTLFDRIMKFDDLVSAEIVYDDDTSREIHFHWNKKDEYSNRYQSSYKTKNGYLIVAVSKKKRAKDLREIVERS